MKKILFLIFLCHITISCSNNVDEKENLKKRDLSFTKDTTNADSIGRDSILQDTLMVITEKSYLESFLENPIDLQQFKKDYGPSNSGGMNGGLLYKPDSAGMYLRFMLFNGNSDRNRKLRISEGQKFKQLQFYVYRYGKTVGDFFDTNEILVGFKCKLEDESLGKANLVGKTEKEIIDLFGNGYSSYKNYRIYENNNRVLSLYITESKVLWVKYYHLASPFSKDNIPALLLEFDI